MCESESQNNPLRPLFPGSTTPQFANFRFQGNSRDVQDDRDIRIKRGVHGTQKIYLLLSMLNPLSTASDIRTNWGCEIGYLTLLLQKSFSNYYTRIMLFAVLYQKLN